MLVLSSREIGENFVQVGENEIIKGYFQYLNNVEGKWKISTYSANEKYTNPNGIQVYRRPINIYGWLQIIPQLTKKYTKKILGIK